MSIPRRLTAIAGMAGSAMLLIGSVLATRAEPASTLVSDSRLSGPGVGITVTIPAGWHQLADQSNPQILQMVYPTTCSQGLSCASAMARLFSTQAASAQAVAQAAEQAIAGQPGIQSASITSEGPTQIAGKNGYQLRFIYSHANAKFQAAAAAVETGPASAGMVPTSLVLVAVSDLAGAPPATAVDQIVGSTKLATPQK